MMASCCLVKESAGTQRSSPVIAVVVVIVVIGVIGVGIVHVTNEEGQRERTINHVQHDLR